MTETDGRSAGRPPDTTPPPAVSVTERGPESRWLTVFGTVVGCEMRRFVRHRLALVSALGLPIAMAVLMTAALGGDAEIETRLAVADLDGGTAAEAFIDEALGHPEIADMMKVEHVESADAAQQLVDREDADAAIVLPEGFTAALSDPGSADRQPGGITGDPLVVRSDDNPIAGDLAALLVNQFTIRAHATTVAAQEAGDGTGTERAWPLEVAVTAPEGDRHDGATAVGPPVALFFALATLGFAAQSLVADRDRGILERLAAAPTPRSALLAGRAVAGGVIGSLSLATLVVVLQAVYGQNWGPPLPLALVILGAVAAMVGVAAVVAALARTPGQAQSFSVGLAFVFLLASGSFSATGAGRTSFAELVPNTHALDGFALLATENAGLATIGGSLAMLAAFAVGGLTLAAISSRRLVG